MIKVKALEFVASEDGQTYQAHISGRVYYAYYTESHGCVIARVKEDGHPISKDTVGSMDKALSALQAHHTQHVLSMIEIETPTNQGKQT